MDLMKQVQGEGQGLVLKMFYIHSEHALLGDITKLKCYLSIREKFYSS